MAANLADVSPQTGAFRCKIFNTVTGSAPNDVSANPFYKLQKNKKKLKSIGLHFERIYHYWQSHHKN
jgi:hypothetical protein